MNRSQSGRRGAGALLWLWWLALLGHGCHRCWSLSRGSPGQEALTLRDRRAGALYVVSTLEGQGLFLLASFTIVYVAGTLLKTRKQLKDSSRGWKVLGSFLEPLTI